MKKTIDLGKFAYSSNRKINRITIDIELREGNILSICGNILNATQTDFFVCGQCEDTINNIIEKQASESIKSLWHIIYYLWKNYHLNDMHPGTPEQEKLLEQNSDHSYNHDHEFLKQYNMLEVPAEKADPYRKEGSKHIGEPYIYGNEWLVWPLPYEIINIINALLK